MEQNFYSLVKKGCYQPVMNRCIMIRMKTVAIIFGSRSTEHDVSIITAINAVINPLKLGGKYNVLPVYISKDGKWYLDDKLGEIEFFTSGHIDDKLAKLKPLSLKFDDGLWLAKPGLGGKTKIDVVFPATHGTYGEDGSLMGLLEMAGVPYVGCGLSASVVAMDKVLSKQVTGANNIPTNKWTWLSKGEFTENQSEILKKLSVLSMPLFVKPAHLGSSIGISRVKNEKELTHALEVAFHYDDKVIVEEEVQNLVEVTVPVMGNEEVRVAMVEEALNKDADFFDFDTKYMQGGKKGKTGKKGGKNYSRIPARLSKELYEECEQIAQNVYRAVGCEGMARVDLLVDAKANKVYFNEVNPMPGSLYQHNWNKAGVNNIELVNKLIDLALERSERQKKQNTTFKTNFLQQF